MQQERLMKSGLAHSGWQIGERLLGATENADSNFSRSTLLTMLRKTDRSDRDIVAHVLQ